MKRFDSATCPNCQTLFDRLPVDGDEDGAYVALEVKPCATCGTLLCPCCEQFVCEHGDTHCVSHLTVLDAESKYPVKCCPVCIAEMDEADRPAKIEPQTAPTAVPQVECPWCELPIAAGQSTFAQLGEVLHVSCANERDDWQRQMGEEFDDQQCSPRGAELEHVARIAPQIERKLAEPSAPATLIVERYIPIDRTWIQIRLVREGDQYVFPTTA